MVWWIVAALVVVPLAVLGLVASSLRDRMAELERVRDLVKERAATQAGKLRGRVVHARARLAGVNRRSAVVRARLAQRRHGRPADGGSPGGA